MLLQLFFVSNSYSTGSAFGLTTLSVLDIFDIAQHFVCFKSNCVSQLINGRSRDLQNLLKYFHGTTTCASNILLLFGVLLIIFILK